MIALGIKLSEEVDLLHHPTKMIFSLRNGCLFIFTFVSLSASIPKLRIVHKWKYIDFVWGSAFRKQQAASSGLYNKTQIIVNDVQPLRDGRILVTLPKWFYDNPASLATITSRIGSGGPLLQPYPSWSLHTAPNCSGITSISRVVAGKRNRLWAVDTGVISGRPICSAKIYVIDLKTDRITRKIDIPDDVSLGGELELHVVEEKARGAGKPGRDIITLYIADVKYGALVIWNGLRIWRIDDSIFKAHADDPPVSVGGYDLDLNVFGAGLSLVTIPPPGIYNTDVLFFKSLASVKGFVALRDQVKNPDQQRIDFYESDTTLSSQELVSNVASNGIMFGGVAKEMTIVCWNTLNPLQPEYQGLFETDAENLQFPFAVKIVKKSRREDVWYVSNRLTEYLAGAMDFGKYNFRVLTGNVDELTAGGPCDPKNATRRQFDLGGGGIEEDADNMDFHLIV